MRGTIMVVSVAETSERATPPKRRRGRDIGSRFEDIVDAAADLFSEQGYAATSIQDIADRVGLLKGSLYHYINTKEDLLHAVIQEAHHHTAALGVEALALDGNAIDKLTFVVERHLSGAAGNLAKVRVFYREAKFLPRDRLEDILATRDSYEHSLRQIIVAGREEGVFASHLDPTLTAIAILAILNSVQQWYRPAGPRTLEEVTAAFTDLVLRSVAGDPRREPPKRPRSGTGSTPVKKR
jgi:TetR/AcrR family transcriptional regulator, cholesterol catabolism regulator